MSIVFNEIVRSYGSMYSRTISIDFRRHIFNSTATVSWDPQYK